MEAYVCGVSTRSVDDLVGAMGVQAGISRSEVSRICSGLDERSRGRHAVVCTRQPTSFYRELEPVRRLYDEGAKAIPVECLALVSAADCVSHLACEVIPALLASSNVISDRFCLPRKRSSQRAASTTSGCRRSTGSARRSTGSSSSSSLSRSTPSGA